MDMNRKTTTPKKWHLRALAVLAAVLGAGLISVAPARADHRGPDVGFHFFFGLPFPPFPVPVYEPPVYYEPPAYDEPPVYYERPHYERHWRGDWDRDRGYRRDWDDEEDDD
jgi:hypothetical protein